MTEAEEFLAAWNPSLTADTRMCLCGFPGDPAEADPQAWAPRPWAHSDKIPYPPRYNVYVTISSFNSNLNHQRGHKEWRRRKANFAAGQAFMIDDVGTKVSRSIVEKVPPSAIVETSPGNEQWWYFLSPPEPAELEFDGLITAFIQDKLITDPGMTGVTRVGRLPGYRNAKPQHHEWACRTLLLKPNRRYNVALLTRVFDLRSMGVRMRRPYQQATEDVRERVEAFKPMYRWLQHNGLFKREEDPSGWIEMTCPWVGHHTNSIDNGAALRKPHLENQYVGAFKCNHGHCMSRGWNDVTEWIASEAAENLEMVANSKRDLYLEMLEQSEDEHHDRRT